ncbi:FemAB family protein [uncultured archaeon]|nr:FemAB family protein [uncultured archaeon]
MEICELKSIDEKKWDEYVFNHPQSTFYHQLGWKRVIEKSYGHKSYYFLAKEDDEIIGVLPMFLFKNLVFGRKLISVPFAPYGGAVGNVAAVRALIDHAFKLAKELDVEYLELRSKGNSSNLLTTSLYTTSILKLDPNPDVVWKERLTRNKRKNIVKSQKRNLNIQFSNEIEEFYKIFAINMRDLGSPMHSKIFFTNILHEFPDSSKTQIVSLDKKPLYAAFYIFYKNTMINSWSSTLEEYRNFYPTDGGIWTAIEYGCLNNYRYYDFGRSQQGSPNMEFKERWGAETQELDYQYYLNRGIKIPDYTSNNQKRKIFTKIWKRLPLLLTNVIGKSLRKEVP